MAKERNNTRNSSNNKDGKGENCGKMLRKNLEWRV